MDLVIEYKIQLLNNHDVLEDIYVGFSSSGRGSCWSITKKMI